MLTTLPECLTKQCSVVTLPLEFCVEHLFGQVNTTIGCNQLPIFCCTNVHLRRNTCQLFRLAASDDVMSENDSWHTKSGIQMFTLFKLSFLFERRWQVFAKTFSPRKKWKRFENETSRTEKRKKLHQKMTWKMMTTLWSRLMLNRFVPRFRHSAT